MKLQHYIDEIHRQAEAVADARGDDARTLAVQLIAPLDAAIRLALLEALTEAAQEITCELAPGSVQVRLHGRDPEFVVTIPSEPPADSVRAGRTATANDLLGATQVGDFASEEGGTSRINLRMPDQLKARVEQAAALEGISVNAWLVRTVAANVEPRGPRGKQRVTGWVR